MEIFSVPPKQIRRAVINMFLKRDVCMWAEQTISSTFFKHGKNEASTAVFEIKHVNSDIRQMWKAVANTPPPFTREGLNTERCQLSDKLMILSVYVFIFSQRILCPSIRTTNRLMYFKEVSDVYFKSN